MTALRALLAGIVDYAGLFPPAELDMPAAVRNYAEYRASDDAWMLGRFVVQVARLDEFCDALVESVSKDTPDWRVAAIAGADRSADAARVRRFNASHAVPAAIDCVEAKVASVDDVARAAEEMRGLEFFAELPARSDPRPLVEALATHRLKAKIRTGGVTGDAFPDARSIVRFIRACDEARVSFKATAGLHHPFTAVYPLTYEPTSATHRMFGFVNVFLAPVFLAADVAEDEVCRLLEESNPAAFTITESRIAWRDRAVDVDQIARARDRLACSFGSCSFREPVEGLHTLTPLA